MPDKKLDFAKLERMVCNPKTLESILELLTRIDIRASLPNINLPVLVLHSRDDVAVFKLNGRYLADNINGSKYIEYPSGGHLPWHEERENIVKDLVTFFSSTGDGIKSADRNLATILFTDIEDSTKQMTEMGDKQWSEKMNKHDEIMRNTIESFNGKLVKNTGDGVLAVFDGPARSIESAISSIVKLNEIDLRIRCSLHVGEVIWRNDDITGIAVNIAARALEKCQSNEVIITKNLKDLLGRTKFSVISMGDFTLKGLEDNWELFKVENSE